MVELRRTVRFCINSADASRARGVNAFAASPPSRGLGRYYEIDIRCRGEVDAATGYLVDIKDVDREVRDLVIPIITDACDHRPATDPGSLVPAMLTALAPRLRPLLAGLTWRLTPYHSVEMVVSDTRTLLIRQRFDFAAAHRLHAPHLSDEENRARFGKCNNPSGHGHNYSVEPCIAVPLNADGSVPLTIDDIERIVDRTLLDRFDHMHLNVDTAEFSAERGGSVPSVENISRVCYQLLSPALSAACPVAELRSLTVWETDRTSCTYPA